MSILTQDNLYNYMNGKIHLPKEVGQADIIGKKSNSNIEYYRWDLEFLSDTDALKPDNLGNDEVQIIFNLNQDIEWNVGKENSSRYQLVSMKKGDVCIYRNDNIYTSMHYKGGVGFQFKSLQMKTERFEEILNAYFNEDERKRVKDKIYKKVEKTVITPDMYRVLSEIDSADRFKEFQNVFLEMKMLELTSLVIIQVLTEKNVDEEGSFLSDTEDIKLMEELRERIQIEPYNEYGAEYVASELNMSVSKMNRIFRKLYATSLHAYVEEQRLEYAARLLMEGNHTVTEAAIQAGYYHMSHFSKKFKERFGISPKDFVSEKC